MSPINDSTFRALFDDLFLELTENSIFTASERIVGSQAALGLGFCVFITTYLGMTVAQLSYMIEREC